MDEHRLDVDADDEQIACDVCNGARTTLATSRSGLLFPMPLAPRGDRWWPFAG